MLAGVGAVMSIAAIIGTFVGINADTRPAHIIGSSVSGFIHEASTVFLCLKSSAYSRESCTLPSLSAFAATAFTLSLYLLIVDDK